MNIRLGSLLICALLFLSFSQLSSLSANSRPSQQFQQFSKKLSFSGECNFTDDGRIFTKLTGTFNLPKPIDSSILCKNSDIIMKQLMNIYKQNGANFTLKMISTPGYTLSCQYIQYWKQFYLIHQPYYLLITYHPDTKRYTIYNNLYMGKIEIPEKAISMQTAEVISNFFNNDSLKTDLSVIPRQYNMADTMHIFYRNPDNAPGYGDRYLNLFSNLKTGNQQTFDLQWRYYDTYMNAVTGEYEGETAKQWNDKVKKCDAIHTFIHDSGLSANCYARIELDGISFGEIKLPPPGISDSLSLRTFVDKIMPYYVRLHKQIGQEIRLGYDKTKLSYPGESEKYFEVVYKQLFRYPGETSFRMTARYNILYKTIDLMPFFYTKRIYPDSVITPQSIMEVNDARTKETFDPFQIQSVVLKYVRTNLLNTNQIYEDPITHTKARLGMYTIGTEEDGIKELTIAWFVKSTKNDYEIWYNPLTGDDYQGGFLTNVLNNVSQGIMDTEQKKIEEAFKPIGKPSNFGFDNHTKHINSFEGVFDLTVPSDTIQIIPNSKSILIHFLKAFHMDSPYISINNATVTLGNYDFEAYCFTADVCFKGIKLIPIFDTNHWEGKFSVKFDKVSQSYRFSTSIGHNFHPLPGCVITPETALDIAQVNVNNHYCWSDLSFLSGSKDYYPHTDKVPPLDSEEENDYYDSAELCYYPILNKETNNYEYTLIWSVGLYGQWFAIDAETGEILQAEEWDMC